MKGMNGSDQLLARDNTDDMTINCDGGTHPGTADKAVLDSPPLDSPVSGCEKQTRPSPYVALGDSLSNGYVSASSPSTRGFVGRLYDEYQALLRADQLFNEAQNGASSTSLRNNGQLAAALADITAPSDTKAVTIEIGGAEAFLGGPCPGHWDEPGVCPVRANLAYIFGKLKTALAGDPGTERFTTMAYYNPNSGLGGTQEASVDTTLLGNNHQMGCSDSGQNVGLNDLIFQEAGKLGIPVTNPYPAFKQHGQAYMSQTDSQHIHPNDTGYAAIAQLFRNASGPCG
jgi:lysophospholipase L1-like esterase